MKPQTVEVIMQGPTLHENLSGAGFFNAGTFAIWGWIIVCCEGLPYTVANLATSLSSTY